MSIIVTGASDDLIEVGGDVVEEFSYQDGDNYVALSDGTVLRVEYTRAGVWRITPVVEGSGFLAIAQAPEGDDDNYTDCAELVLTRGDTVPWAVHGIQFTKARA